MNRRAFIKAIPAICAAPLAVQAISDTDIFDSYKVITEELNPDLYTQRPHQPVIFRTYAYDDVTDEFSFLGSAVFENSDASFGNLACHHGRMTTFAANFRDLQQSVRLWHKERDGFCLLRERGTV